MSTNGAAHVDPTDKAAKEAEMKAAFAREAARISRRDTTAKKRKASEKTTRKTIVDLRTIKTTGRDAHWTIRCSEELRERAKRHVQRRGSTIAEWMESAIEAAIAADEAADAADKEGVP